MKMDDSISRYNDRSEVVRGIYGDGIELHKAVAIAAQRAREEGRASFADDLDVIKMRIDEMYAREIDVVAVGVMAQRVQIKLEHNDASCAICDKAKTLNTAAADVSETGVYTCRVCGFMSFGVKEHRTHSCEAFLLKAPQPPPVVVETPASADTVSNGWFAIDDGGYRHYTGAEVAKVKAGVDGPWYAWPADRKDAMPIECKHTRAEAMAAALGKV